MRFPIRYKMFLSFSLLILAAFFVMSLIINGVIQRSNEQLISREAVKIKEDAAVYARQFFLLNELQPEAEAFNEYSSPLLSDLESKLNIRGELYSRDGKRLTASQGGAAGIGGTDKSLEYALLNRLAFTVSARGKNVNAVIAVPINVDGYFIGVLQYSKDYTEHYSSGYYLRRILTASVFLILILVFVASYMLSNSIIRPVSKLSSMAKAMAEGSFSGEADIRSNDEIGELALSFKAMREQIHSSIKTIERDHMLLVEADSYRKKFFDNVAHEFKTPLAAIRGYAQVMEEGGFEDKAFCGKGTKHIVDECDRLHRMVLSLLMISRQASDNIEAVFKAVDLSGMLHDICEEMSLMAKSRSMDIVRDISRDIHVQGFEDDLKGALMNVVDNAIKYGYEGSEISVKAFAEAGQAVVTVINTGTPIPPDKLEKVFEPFFRADAAKGRQMGGSGLGLSITKSVIEKHSGKVQIESDEKGCTKVNIYIPRKCLQL